MEAYLDNAATTKVFDSAKGIIDKLLYEDYANPSSLHTKGFDAERYIRKSREIIAKNLKVEEKEIIFTSGGTESNNLALIGAAFANRRRGNNIITSVIEHPSVYNAMNFLEEEGFRITYVPVDSMGKLIINELEKEINEDTILISIMYVNNEIGSVQDIGLISNIIKKKNPNALLHVDAIQGFGKYKIYPKKEGIDLLSISGHKIHGPKGIGGLYIRDKVKVRPLLFGGGQEQGFRSGTENLAGIAALGQVTQEIYENHDEKIKDLYMLKEEFIKGIIRLNKNLGGISINALEEDIKKSAPHIVSVSFRDIKSEVLLHALADKGIYVSSGSACSSNNPAISSTLKAIGVSDDLLYGTLRFSFSFHTRIDEISYALSAIEELVPILRKYKAH